MKNLLTYNEFLNEKRGINIGAPGEGMASSIISRVVANGVVKYTDSNGKKFTKTVDEDLQQMADGVMDPNQSNQGSQLNTDPNRTVGTGTYTPVRAADQNVTTKAGSDTTDSSSGGSYPVYIG